MTKLKAKRMKQNKLAQGVILSKLYWIIPLVFIIFLIWAQQNFVMTNKVVYSSTEIPKSFVGFKIIHISDINNSSLDVASKIKKENPDIIVISGGLSDEKGNYTNTLKTVSELTNIASVYYVLGINDTEDVLANTGAIKLEGKVINIASKPIDVNTFIINNYGNSIIKQANKGNEEALQYIEYTKEQLDKTQSQTLAIMGIDKFDFENGEYKAKEQLISLLETAGSEYTILVNSNLANIDRICDTDIDLVMNGGTFGTNILSDEYKKGIYALNGTQLFISGGIGTPSTLTRIFNFPHIQSIVLSDGTIKNENALENFIGKFYKNVGTIFDNDGGFHEYTYKFGGQY